MKKITLLFAAFMTLTASSLMLPQTVYADCTSTNANKQDVLVGVGEAGGNCEGGGVGRLVETIVKILSIIVGIVAVIMIIISGFKYIVSGGDSAKISSAKNTLIYALVGIAVAVLAQVLVNFAFTVSDNAANPPPPKSKTP